MVQSLTRIEKRAMKTTIQEATAADYMQRDLVTVSANYTLREALSLMIENHVTGLPVVGENSRCIGLITSSDILNYEQENAADSADGITVDVFDAETQEWEPVPVSAFEMEHFGDVPVSEVMTTQLVSVERNTPLRDAARRMVEEHVHRVLVLDKKGYLFGILSAIDFARVVAES
jgi:CBS domain-containing protein